MSVFYRIVMLSGLLLLSACSSNSSQPEWLQGNDSQYPEQQYLTATGDADTAQAAADRALANLARIFSVSVNDQSRDQSSAELATVDGITLTRNNQTVSRDLQINSQQLLEGATISERWQNEQGRYFALATLDKNQTAQLLRNDIQQLSMDIDNQVNYANNTANNPVAALQALQQAVVKQLTAESLNRKLLQVSAQGQSFNHSAAELVQQLQDALAMMTVQVQTDSPTLQAQLESAASQLGMKVSTEAQFQLVGKMDTTPIQKIQDWYWIRGAYVLTFKEGSNSLSQQRYPIKVSATDREMVQQRAKDAIDSTLPVDLFALITGEK